MNIYDMKVVAKEHSKRKELGLTVRGAWWRRSAAGRGGVRRIKNGGRRDYEGTQVVAKENMIKETWGYGEGTTPGGPARRPALDQ
jgi:hypothetical protein